VGPLDIQEWTSTDTDRLLISAAENRLDDLKRGADANKTSQKSVLQSFYVIKLAVCRYLIFIFPAALEPPPVGRRLNCDIANERGETALLAAAARSATASLDYLLARGCDVNRSLRRIITHFITLQYITVPC